MRGVSASCLGGGRNNSEIAGPPLDEKTRHQIIDDCGGF